MTESDRSQFEELVRLHHAAVFRAAFRVTRDTQRAEDIAQQVYLRVLEGKLSVGVADDPEAVLCWTAMRLGLNARRDSEVRRRREHRTTETPAMDQTHDHVIRRDERRVLRHTLDRLPEDLRAPLVLRFESGLTFADVGRALECSESTAYERVKRGLAVLRERLQGLGFAALAVRLPDELGEIEAPSVPTGLEESLLGLGATAAKSGLLGGKALAIASCFVLVGTAAVLASDAWRGSTARPGLRVVASTDRPGGSHSASSNEADDPEAASVVRSDVTTGDASLRSNEMAEPDSEHAVGSVAGRVLDQGHRPIVGATVRATSVQRAGKDPRFSFSTTTNATGDYTIDVSIARDEGQAYVITATKRDYELGSSESFVVREGASVFLDPLRLSRWAEDRAGAYALTIRVVDSAGGAIDGADARVYRRSKRDPLTFPAQLECRGRSDQAGVIVLQGDRIGEKRLVVSAVARGFRPARIDLPIAHDGAHERVVVLEPGLEISGRARTIDGEPVGGLSLDLVTRIGADERRPFRTEVDGTFELRGLEARDYLLLSRDSRFSAFTRTIEAGTQDLDVVLKAPHDARAGAFHDGELHGVLVDADTGARIEADAFSVFARPIWLDGATTDLEMLLEAWSPWWAQMAAGPGPHRRDVFYETGLQAGAYVLVAEVDGYAPQFVGPYRLDGTELIDGIEVTLHRGAVVRGRVVDPHGRPVAGAYVSAFPDSGRTEPEDDLRRIERAIEEQGMAEVHHCARSVRSGEDGTFAFSRLPLGLPLRFTAVHEGWLAVRGGRLELRDRETHDSMVFTFAARR